MPEYVIGNQPKKHKPRISCEFCAQRFIVGGSRDVGFSWTISGSFVGQHGLRQRIYVEDRSGQMPPRDRRLIQNNFNFKCNASLDGIETEFRRKVGLLVDSGPQRDFILNGPLSKLLEAVNVIKEMDVPKVYMGGRIRLDERVKIKTDFRPFISKYRYINTTRNDSKPTLYTFVLRFKQPNDKLVELFQDPDRWQNRGNFILLLAPEEVDQFNHEVRLCMRSQVHAVLDS